MWYYSLLIGYVCQLDGFLLCPKVCQQCKQAFDCFSCYVFFDVLPTLWACAARVESDSISIHPPTRGPFGTHVRFFGFLLSLRGGFSMYVTFPCFAPQIGMYVGDNNILKIKIPLVLCSSVFQFLLWCTGCPCCNCGGVALWCTDSWVFRRHRWLSILVF